MAEDIIDWKPMTQDFESLTFNSYGSGQTAAAYLTNGSSPSVGQQNQSLKLCVEGFPSDLTEIGLKNLLQRIGCQFLNVKIFRSTELSKKCRLFAFVDFKTLKEAQNAIELIRNQKFFKLFVCFTASETDVKQKRKVMDKEMHQFLDELNKQNQEMRSNGEIQTEPSFDFEVISVRTGGQSNV